MRIQDFLVLGFMFFAMLYGSWHLGRYYESKARADNPTEAYNQGYRAGELYAYDNIVVCGASPEEEGVRMATLMKTLGELSPDYHLDCGE